MSDIRALVHDSLRRQLAAGDCVAPIVDCIWKMRAEGVTDSEIADLLRHAADELNEAKMQIARDHPLSSIDQGGGKLRAGTATNAQGCGPS